TLGLKITPGDVDCDALLALGLETVEQKAEVDLLAVDGAVMRSKCDRRALVLGHARCVPQQTADQRRLAVIAPAARQEPDPRPFLRGSDRPRLDRDLERCQMHQK